MNKLQLLDRIRAYKLGEINWTECKNAVDLFADQLGKRDVHNIDNDLYVQYLKDTNELDCPYDFTSRCTLGRCDCKPKNKQNKPR